MTNHPHRSRRARYDDLCQRLTAREHATGTRRISYRDCAFRGWGVPEGLPSIGDRISHTDAHDVEHVGIVVAIGAHWSDQPAGLWGRWITIEVPASYWGADDVILEQRAMQLYYELEDASAQ